MSKAVKKEMLTTEKGEKGKEECVHVSSFVIFSINHEWTPCLQGSPKERDGVKDEKGKSSLRCDFDVGVWLGLCGYGMHPECLVGG